MVAADSLSIVGLLEIGRALPMFLKACEGAAERCQGRKPDAVILVIFRISI